MLAPEPNWSGASALHPTDANGDLQHLFQERKKAMEKNSLRLLGFLLVAVMMVSLLGLGVFAGDTVNDVNETATQPSETLTWKDGDVIDGITISKDVTINVSGTVTVNGTIRLAPDAICNVVFNGSENAKLIRGEGFTGQMFYAEGTSANFQKLTFNNITLDGGAVWTGDVDKTLNRGTTNSGVKATGSVLYLVYANATLENGSVLQNHDDSTGEKANAVFLRYYSTFTVNDSIVRNNNSISTTGTPPINLYRPLSRNIIIHHTLE
jgi:hypothetical protein